MLDRRSLLVLESLLPGLLAVTVLLDLLVVRVHRSVRRSH